MTTDNVEPTFAVTITLGELQALDDALRCIGATLDFVSHLRYGRTGELQHAQTALIGLVNRIEQQAAA